MTPILASCFDNFVKKTPLAVMMRALIEKTFGAERINAVRQSARPIRAAMRR